MKALYGIMKALSKYAYNISYLFIFVLCKFPSQGSY